MNNKFLEQANKLLKSCSNEDAKISLADDLNKVYNHKIKNGLEYIHYCLENRLYEKDSHCNKRLSINELEIIEKTIDEDFEILNKEEFYNFTNFGDRITFENIHEIIKFLIKKEIIKII